MARVNVMCHAASPADFTGAGVKYLVKTPGGVFYHVFVDAAVDVVFSKSTDGGVSWTVPTVLFTGNVTALAIWYDRWSNISAGLIHCAYTETTGDDTLYRSIDTENSDTLGTQTTIFAGTSTATGGALSITRARGGNLYCKTTIDAGAEGGFFRSTDVGANWTARTDSEALATTDQWILLPGWAADNQDIMMIFWDASADEISRVLYDDSGDSWAETSIATTMVDAAPGTSFPHFSAAVDITNSQNLLIAWNGVDTANQDLLAWKITESAITALADVVTNGTDDQGLCAIGIDTDTQDLYAFYSGKSDGSELIGGLINVYYKASTDDGATWGAETQLSISIVTTVTNIFANPRSDGFPECMYRVGTGTPASIVFNGDLPAAGGAAGGAHILGGTVVR